MKGDLGLPVIYSCLRVPILGHDLENTLEKVNLLGTLVYSLFVQEYSYACDESILFCVGSTLGGIEYCLDPCLWPLYLFDLGDNFGVFLFLEIASALGGVLT